LIYRRGYVQEAAPVVQEWRCLQDVWQRREPLVCEGSGFDPNRDRTRAQEDPSTSTRVHPLAFLAGPVRVSYSHSASSNVIGDVALLVDQSARTVRSSTGELLLDYGRGLCTLDAPKAQGTCGFHTGAPEELQDVTIVCSNAYASITVVPLDDQPVAESTNVLVQVGTVARPYGWRTEPAQLVQAEGTVTSKCERILSVGGPPWNVERAEVNVTISNPKLRTAHVLDANGMIVDDVDSQREEGKLAFVFPADALYVVVRE